MAKWYIAQTETQKSFGPTVIYCLILKFYIFQKLGLVNGMHT